MTKSDRDDRQAELLDRLGEHVDALRNSDEWLQLLESASKFHRYSANNLMLIWLQKPEATRVAGFRAWQAMGRQVRKGETGLLIYAPMKKTFTREDAVTGEKTKHQSLIGFRLVTVFDVSQTDGDPLPPTKTDLWRDARLAGAGGSDADLLAVRNAAELLGYEIVDEEASDTEAAGWFRPGVAKVHVRTDAPGMMAKTLLHELAHAHDPELGKTPYAQSELVAESAAWIVSHSLGLDDAAISRESAVYLAAWDGKSDELVKVADRILKIARTLTDALVADVEVPELEEVA